LKFTLEIFKIFRIPIVVVIVDEYVSFWKLLGFYVELNLLGVGGIYVGYIPYKLQTNLLLFVNYFILEGLNFVEVISHTFTSDRAS